MGQAVVPAIQGATGAVTFKIQQQFPVDNNNMATLNQFMTDFVAMQTVQWTVVADQVGWIENSSQTRNK